MALLLMAAPALAACSHHRPSVAVTSTTQQAIQENTPPPALLGNFSDDYGGTFTVTASDFVQLPNGRFRIRQWNVAQQYLIAQNDSLNLTDPGKWTRIDWMTLEDMPPYTWAFCFTSYKASVRAEAENAIAPQRDAPKSGCSGYPFTRMKPVLPH